MSLLGILELKKNTGATVFTKRSILCLQLSHFLSLIHSSHHRVQLLHQSLSLYHHQFYCLHHFCSWYLLAYITGRHYIAPAQSLLEKKISNMFTLIGKKFLSLNQFRLTPLQWKVHLLNHQHLPLILMFLLPYIKVNGLILFIIFPNLCPMIVLIPLFVSLSCPCLLYLYSSHMRMLY